MTRVVETRAPAAAAPREAPFTDRRARGAGTRALLGSCALAAGLVLAACASTTESATGSGGSASASASAFKQPKTPWGEPDLRGLWPVDHLNGTPLQRPAQYGEQEYVGDEEYAQRVERAAVAKGAYDRAEAQNKLGMSHWAERGDASRRTSLIVEPKNGQLPALTPAGQKASDAMRSSWPPQTTWDWVTDFDSWDRCITRGMPASMFPFQYNNGIRIFQSPGIVAINMEMIHETRIIPTDGRAPLPQTILHWMGESRGHWEGNTLVVETTNLMPGPSMTNVGTTGSPQGNKMPVSEHSKIVERFTMTGPDDLTYEMTFSDPTLYTADWTARADWKRNSDYGMFEYACHEGNVQVPNYISASRAQRAAAAKAPRAPRPAAAGGGPVAQRSATGAGGAQ